MQVQSNSSRHFIGQFQLPFPKMIDGVGRRNHDRNGAFFDDKIILAATIILVTRELLIYFLDLLDSIYSVCWHKILLQTKKHRSIQARIYKLFSCSLSGTDISCEMEICYRQGRMSAKEDGVVENYTCDGLVSISCE